MKFLVITLAPTLKSGNLYSAYAPYVKEMDLWFEQVDAVTILSPTRYDKKLLTAPFKREDIRVVSIPWLSFNSFTKVLVSIFSIPIIFLKMAIEMRKADHIHLRCPGTIGLAGCVIQILFPNKKKTAKYAGNWDPKAKQPLSYRLQKWILSTTFLTKNMQVLVYGEWKNQSKNIKPFFTASYFASEILITEPKSFKSPFRLLFVGALVEGKRTLYAIKLVENLILKGNLCTLTLYGDGVERAMLETYVRQKNMEKYIVFNGNQATEKVKLAYQQSDFLILPSKSEGWPKVVAEAMFWGVIPIVTAISCVPWMVANGNRGVMLDLNLESDVSKISAMLQQNDTLQKMSKNAQEWSQQYTLDAFSNKIKSLL